MNESFGGLTLAIVGGGLSGALVAIHLLRQSPSGTRILLVERRVAAGRGVAYSTECPDHLLNVPAGRISLFPAEPEHFLDWLRARARPGSAEIAAADFLPRSLFGRYVVETLAAAEANANPGVALIRVHGEAVDLEEIAPGRAKLTLADAVSTRIGSCSHSGTCRANTPSSAPCSSTVAPATCTCHGRRASWPISGGTTTCSWSAPG